VLDGAEMLKTTHDVDWPSKGLLSDDLSAFWGMMGGMAPPGLTRSAVQWDTPDRI